MIAHGFPRIILAGIEKMCVWQEPGLFSGDDNQHTIRPDDQLSRAEAAKLLALLLTDAP